MTTQQHKLRYPGTHRLRTPQETLTLVQPLLRECGITRIANITGLDEIGIPTVLVTRPLSRSVSVTQGKGCDLVAAKASAVMEAIEQFAAERIVQPSRSDSFERISRLQPVVDVGRLPGYFVPFDLQATLPWIEATSLQNGEPCWVPFGMVHLDLTMPLPPGSGFFPLGSNGLASGNSLEEAVAHGLWEVIERDALALFYTLSIEQRVERRIALGTIDAPSCKELLERYERAQVRVAVWDITFDVGIAAFRCAIFEQSVDVFHPIGKACGFGCHIDREVALCRALTEAAQSRLTRIAGSRDDIQAEELAALHSQSSAQQHSELDAGEGKRSYRSVPSQCFDSFERDMGWTLHRLAAVGCGEAVYVDLSPPGFPVAVARVIVPGLEGHPEIPGYTAGARVRRLAGVT